MNTMQTIGYACVFIGSFGILVTFFQIVRHKRVEDERQEGETRGWTDPTSRSLKIKRKNARKL